ncbi:hypothetical protein ES332_D03G064300v1 [Gossypium tomentosum]|uniref:Uncharacterized protein n=1 Tax=Gossypium tomentosum TaxID=34277 RepID=A0A5D2LJC1_GOSTO|nr:hypothetical protein ES332_D03G064300v1 [Gossypium tomentosum]
MSNVHFSLSQQQPDSLPSNPTHTSQSESQLTSNQNTQPPVALNPTLIFSISVDSRTGKTKNPQFLFRRSPESEFRTTRARP